MAGSVLRDAGHPDFLQHKRRVTGTSLAMPTLAERLKRAAAPSFSAMSRRGRPTHTTRTGTAMSIIAPAPSGRAASSANRGPPRRHPRQRRRPAYDGALRRRGSDAPPASAPCSGWASPTICSTKPRSARPEYLAALAAADTHAGLVIAAGRAAARGRRQHPAPDRLRPWPSSVSGIVDIDAELIAAGLKEGPGSGDVMSVSNGTSALIYVHPNQVALQPALRDFFASRDWVGALFGPMISRRSARSLKED